MFHCSNVPGNFTPVVGLVAGMSVVYASKETQSVSRYDNMVLNVFPLPVHGLYMSCMSAGYKKWQ